MIRVSLLFGKPRDRVIKRYMPLNVSLFLLTVLCRRNK